VSWTKVDDANKRRVGTNASLTEGQVVGDDHSSLNRRVVENLRVRPSDETFFTRGANVEAAGSEADHDRGRNVLVR
jgi:hypothetical protein